MSSSSSVAAMSIGSLQWMKSWLRVNAPLTVGQPSDKTIRNNLVCTLISKRLGTGGELLGIAAQHVILPRVIANSV